MGSAFLHLIPEAIHKVYHENFTNPDEMIGNVLLFVLLGFILFFSIKKNNKVVYRFNKLSSINNLPMTNPECVSL